MDKPFQICLVEKNFAERKDLRYLISYFWPWMKTLGAESVTLNIDFEVSTQGETRHKRRERKTSYSRKIAPKAREMFAILSS